MLVRRPTRRHFDEGFVAAGALKMKCEPCSGLFPSPPPPCRLDAQDENGRPRVGTSRSGRNQIVTHFCVITASMMFHGPSAQILEMSHPQ